MDLVRDLLDQRVVDRKQRPIGRVDGLVLELRDNRPPRVAAIEVGLVTAARRLHPRLGRWVRAFGIRWSPVPLTPVRLPLRLVRDIGVDIELDVDAAADPKLLRLEKWLSRCLVHRFPGGKPEKA
jgi:hypothetical protein